MQLSITPIVSMMPDASRNGRSMMEYLSEFEDIIGKDHGNQIHFDLGSMLVFTGACVKDWYRVAGVRRKWVRDLKSDEVFALGVDAFETGVD